MAVLTEISHFLNEESTSGDRIRRSSLIWAAYFAVIMAVAGAISLLGLRQMTGLSVIAWLVFLSGAAAILYKPRYGVYLVVFGALAGDSVLSPWYPFIKGLSSIESVLFVNRSLIISPLEIYLLLILISWFGRGVAQRKITLYRGDLTIPLLIFAGFTLLGIGYGLGTGGSFNVALWEARPLFHMFVVYFFTTNLIETRGQINKLIWAAMFGVLCMAISGSYYYLVTLNGLLQGVESITEHGSAIQINTFFIMLLVAWMYKGSSGKRWGLLLGTPILLITYFAAQRRAAFLSLFVALFVLVLFLYKDYRRIFWLIIPAIAVVGLLYTVAFWNSGSRLAIPVQALKTIIAPDEVSTRDQASNEYRVLENINTSFTIHQKPLTGVGFGQKFYVIVPMPDISFFIWWEYITHNSIIWVWMKMGVGGFLALIYLVGVTLSTGIYVTNRMPVGDMRSIALAATLYVLMHFIYAYVDMSWDSRSMVYIGAMMALLNIMEHVVVKQTPLKRKRWPWQPELAAETAILPTP